MGRPRKLQLSAQEQEAALTSLAFGVPADSIAAAYGIVGHTLVAYLTPERVAAKRAELDGRIARSLFHKATTRDDTTAQIFLAKARLGYRDGWERNARSEDEGAPRVVVTGGLPEPEKS